MRRESKITGGSQGTAHEVASLSDDGTLRWYCRSVRIQGRFQDVSGLSERRKRVRH